MWWNGPEFLLWPESEWPVSPTTSAINEAASSELVKNQLSIVHALPVASIPVKNQVDISKVINCERCSRMNRLLRVTACMCIAIRA